MKKNNPIGDYIRIKRAELRISQTEVAIRTGHMQATISEIENGTKRTKDDTLLSIFTRGFRMHKDEALRVLVELRIKEMLLKVPERQARKIIKAL